MSVGADRMGLVTRPVAAVTVDLDDTLYPQEQYLAGAWSAVAQAGAEAGLDRGALEATLVAVCAEGSDRGRIIDRALERLDAPTGLVPPLVQAFKSFVPGRLDCYPGARQGLARLRRIVPVACITDGDPDVQWAKLMALGLVGAFDAVVISDVIGREFRKPSPVPFRLALDLLQVPADLAVHVGDRPAKDVAGAHGAGMRSILVRQGEYANQAWPPLGPAPVAAVHDVGEAFGLIEDIVLADGPRSPALA